ncbi:MAG TPA: hypothetical protein VJU61_19190, partial [Polyangiaceae bacterium]|nr:hypothetical protein [Polyangiaceae bacterium]
AGAGGAGSAGAGGSSGYGGAAGAPEDPRDLCGNGVIDPGEDCDGSNLNGETCGTFMPGTVGELSCEPYICRFRPFNCEVPELCGNGVIDDGEDCDGADLDGMTCDLLRPGFSGELSCEPNICRFNQISCERTCGNGVIDDGEECDSQNFNGLTCATAQPGTEGNLHCTPSCTVDTGTCHSTCGNGIKEEWEACDPGIPLPPDSCTECNPECQVVDLPCP